MRIIVVSAPIAESELAADALWQLGARGVEERVVSDAAELRAAMGDEAVVVERGASGAIRRTEVFETLLKPLVNARQPVRFRF